MGGWRRSNDVNEWPCTPDCPKRQPGCHSKCPDYAAAKVVNDTKKAKIRAKRDEDHAVNDYFVTRVCKSTGKPQGQR